MIEIEERSGTLATIKRYKFESTDDDCFAQIEGKRKYKVEITEEKKNGGGKVNFGGRWTNRALNFLGGIFLPDGYPYSVSKDYMSYQIWDSIQNMASSLARAFSTEAVFKSLGVGDASATALTAVTISTLRNVSRWSGEIFFAWLKGNAFGYNNKKWRLFADVFNDVMRTLELVSPLFSSWYRILILCVSSLINGFVTVAGSSSRPAVIKHQARTGNIADVIAKDSSQERLLNFTSLISLVILPSVSGNSITIWAIFGGCNLVHILTNYFAVRALKFEYFNEERLLYCLKQFSKGKEIPSIKEANRKESFILGLGITAKSVCGMRIKMGVPVDVALALNRNPSKRIDVFNLLKSFEDKSFLITSNPKSKWRSGIIYVVLGASITPVEMIEAYFKAFLFAKHENPMSSLAETEWLKLKDALETQKYDLSQFIMKFEESRASWRFIADESEDVENDALLY